MNANARQESKLAAASGSLSDLAYNNILERIVNGTYPPQSKLPPEDELSRELGISRPVLRKALARLRGDNLIVSRRGSGSYVMNRPDNTALSYAPISSLQDMQRCFEFRTGLEAEFAALAAERRSSEALAQIKEALDEINSSLEIGKSNMEADYRFHLLICQAADNQYYLDTFVSLYDSIRVGMQLMSQLADRKPQQRFALIREEHLSIYEAILRGDAQLARTATSQHIDSARRRMFDSGA